MSKNNNGEVKSFFDDAKNYHDSNFCIRIRKEFVDTVTVSEKFDSIIDIGCGTGELSVPLLEKCSALTLVDISEVMLERAKQKVAADYEHKVTYIAGNFTNIDFGAKQFDLVICTGVLAHVDKYPEALEKACQLTAPNGILILQNAKAEHLYSKLIALFAWIKQRFSRRKYLMNRVKHRFVINITQRNGLTPFAQFRSVTSFLFVSRFINNSNKYGIVKRIFGSPMQNKCKALGNDVIYAFRKK